MFCPRRFARRVFAALVVALIAAAVIGPSHPAETRFADAFPIAQAPFAHAGLTSPVAR